MVTAEMYKLRRIKLSMEKTELLGLFIYLMIKV